MARIIVTTDPTQRRDALLITGETPVLLDESICSVHLSTEHAASQLIERIAWAVADAESAERQLPGLSHASDLRAERLRRPDEFFGELSPADSNSGARRSP